MRLIESLHQKQVTLDSYKTAEHQLRSEILILNEICHKLDNQVRELSGNILLMFRVLRQMSKTMSVPARMSPSVLGAVSLVRSVASSSASAFV